MSQALSLLKRRLLRLLLGPPAWSIGSASADLIPWGGVEKPDQAPDFSPSSLIIGAPGSGKSLLLRCTLAALLDVRLGAPTRRFLMLDEKRDAFCILRGLGLLPSRVVIANPLDVRSRAWDMARDVATDTEARQVALSLFPKGRGDNKEFFDKAARSLVAGVIQVLQRVRAGNWALLDVLRALAEPNALRSHLSATKRGRYLTAIYLDLHPKTTAAVIATIEGQLAPFWEVAELWARTREKFSMTHWATTSEPYGIILGADDKHSATLRPLAQLLFRRASELITSRLEEYPAKEKEAVFVLDELTAAGKLDTLKELCEKGRTKGARTLAAFQDFDSLCSVYGGEAGGRALAGYFGNIALLRLTGTGSMKWASELLGQKRFWTTSYSSSRSSRGDRTEGWQTSRMLRHLMEGSAFRELPLASIEHGISGVFGTPGLGLWRGTIEPAFVSKWLRAASDDPGFVAREDIELDDTPVDDLEFASFDDLEVLPLTTAGSQETEQRRRLRRMGDDE